MEPNWKDVDAAKLNDWELDNLVAYAMDWQWIGVPRPDDASRETGFWWAHYLFWDGTHDVGRHVMVPDFHQDATTLSTLAGFLSGKGIAWQATFPAGLTTTCSTMPGYHHPAEGKGRTLNEALCRLIVQLKCNGGLDVPPEVPCVHPKCPLRFGSVAQRDEHTELRHPSMVH